MKILITGASGYVGSAALKIAEDRNHEVAILSRPGTAESVRPSINIDLKDIEGLRAAARGFDAVIHCAASDNPDFWPISRAAALAMIDGLGAQGAFASHAGSVVFGDTGTNAVEPTTFRAPPPLAAKVELDQAILEAGHQGVRTYVVYGSLIYGLGRRAVIPALLIDAARRAGASLYLGDGLQQWSSAHVNDFGALLVDAVERGPSGGHPLFAAGKPYTLKEVANMISRTTSLPERSISISKAGKELGMFANALSLNQHFSSKTARDDCQWQPLKSDDNDALSLAINSLASDRN